jgi:hypothetical protein
VTAEQVKTALYARHFASSNQMPGAWTCIEEWRNIDLLAFSAWQSKGNYARVGYEVKVSRSDLRGELLKPHKRAANVAWCNEFYLAVPAGLLKPEEIAYVEPEWEDGDFTRSPCPARNDGDWHSDPGPCRRGKRLGTLIGPLPEWGSTYRHRVDYPCATCGGRGWIEKSRVEREAPTLWVPRDVGLVVVDGRGTHLVKRAPRRREVPQMTNAELGQFARFVSMRPDPRHAPRREAHIAYRDRAEAAA